MQPAPSHSSQPASSTSHQTQTATPSVSQSNATSTPASLSTPATSSPSPSPVNGAPSATLCTTQNNTANHFAPVRVKFDKLLKWLRKDWDLKLLALLALVWGIKTYNEQIRGNKLNEMEACRNHPNDAALQNTSLCTEMRKAHDFDELVRRSTERVPDVLHHPFVWRDIFKELFFALLVVLAVWRSLRNMDASRLAKVSIWLGGLYIAWSLKYSTSTEFLSGITIIGAATLFDGCILFYPRATLPQSDSRIFVPPQWRL